MDNGDSISFSSLLAGLLLFKRVITSSEIINKINFFEEKGIFVDDENDDINCLNCCVEIDHYRVFSIKKGLDYGSYVDAYFTVAQYLRCIAGDRVVKLIMSQNTDCKVIFDHNIVVSNSFSDGNLYSRKKTKLKKKNNFLSYLDSFLCF